MFSQHLKIRKFIFRESDLFCVSGHLLKLFKIVKQQTPATILSHICTDCDKGVLFLTKMPTYFYFSSAQWLQRDLQIMHSEAKGGLKHLYSTKAITYDERSKMKRDAWLKAVCFLGKTAFSRASFFIFGRSAYIVPYRSNKWVVFFYVKVNIVCLCKNSLIFSSKDRWN